MKTKQKKERNKNRSRAKHNKTTIRKALYLEEAPGLNHGS